MDTIELSKDIAIKDAITTLNLINFQMAELARIKEELESRLNTLFEHAEEGQKTYTYDKWKITIKSGYNYSLNKEEYESVGSRLPKQFNPVTERIAYDINKNIVRDAEKYAGKDDLELLCQFISKKPSKLNIKITAGV